MNALDYYSEQVEQFISMLEEDIKDGEGTIVTQTKLATYKEVLEHLEEIKKAESHALEKISHLKDRPCDVCEFRKENGCCKWDCVFDL